MIIFSPGPANISERVRKALLGPDINHRGPDFKKLLDETRNLLLKVCPASEGYNPIIFTGSGTAAIEASLLTLRNALEPLLIVSNGIYSERAYEISLLNGLNVHKLEFPINSKVNLNIVSEAMDRIKPAVTYLVHHETSTGILNPLRDLAEVAKNKNSLVMVDAISSIAGEQISLKDWHIDIIIGSANKCIRATPGLSFVLASNKFIKLCSRSKEKAYYLSLIKHLDYEKRGETPFTPAVQTFYALREALRELMEESVDKRIEHYAKIAKLLRSGLMRLGLRLFLDEALLSNTMTTVFLPQGISFEYLYQQTRKMGYEIYDSMGQLRGKTFRLGTVGFISQNDIQSFLSVLESILKKKKKNL